MMAPTSSGVPRRASHQQLRGDQQPQLAVDIGLGCIVALYHRVPFHNRFTKIFGTSIPETTMRPNPRWAWAGMALRGAVWCL